jgi:RNA polymerase sigma-54 factor
MGLEIKQNLRLQQQLAITPQLQQAIKLLQLNHMELLEQVQQEMLENPTLEEVPDTAIDTTSDAERILEQRAVDANNDIEEQNNNQNLEVDWNKYLEDRSAADQGAPRGSAGMEELPPIETNLVGRESLAEHLEWQLQMQSCTDGERAACTLIVNNLDDRGWLAVSLDDLVTEHGLDREDVECALDIVQHLDPLGCGARNLEECLLVQLGVHWPDDTAFQEIVRHHLGDVEKRNYAAIARALQLELEDVVEYHKMLKALEPWPGRDYTSPEPQYISPDVYVFKIGDEWQVVQNEDGLPKLRISSYYKQVLQGKDSTRQERDYIKERLNSADFLIKSIYKRQNTIGRVMRCILRRQDGFFDHGPDQLRPMVLRDVADELGIHESTVSRVTSNKYVQCPQGIFELKFFFNNGVNAVHGEQVAAEAVKRRIKKLIQAEDPTNPLSDDAVVRVLQKENIDIARRTVAKYREAMGILPSSKRRNVC